MTVVPTKVTTTTNVTIVILMTTVTKKWGNLTTNVTTKTNITTLPTTNVTDTRRHIGTADNLVIVII